VIEIKQYYNVEYVRKDDWINSKPFTNYAKATKYYNELKRQNRSGHVRIITRRLPDRYAIVVLRSEIKINGKWIKKTWGITYG